MSPKSPKGLREWANNSRPSTYYSMAKYELYFLVWEWNFLKEVILFAIGIEEEETPYDWQIC